MSTLSPEEHAQWLEIAKTYHQSQQKMVQKRKQLQALAKSISERQRTLGLDADARLVTFLQLQKRFTELSLTQLETFSLDSNVYQPPTGVQSPAYEARQLELTLIGLCLDRLRLGRLNDALTRDLSKLDTPAPAGTSETWLAERERMIESPERCELWARFQQDFAALDAGLSEALTAQAAQEPPATPVEYRERMRELKVPALNGLAYRVTTALKAVPDGEELANALASSMLASARTGRPRPLTDRLKGLFKAP